MTEITSNTSDSGVAKTIRVGGSYTLASDAFLTSTVSHGLLLTNSNQDYTVKISGAITADDADGAAIYLDADDNTAAVTNASAGVLAGAYGFYVGSGNAGGEFRNDGKVDAAIDGVRILADGDFTVRNAGEMFVGSGVGINFTGDGNLIVKNQGTMHGAIISTGATRDDISNSGLIEGGMKLGAGNDLVHNDTILDGILIGTADMGSGNDTFYGGSQADTVLGGSDDDVLVGFGGNDVLSGGTGADSLQGGKGVDTLTGGTGDDDYHVDLGDLVIEKKGDSMDRVFAYSSFKLSTTAYIEVITLRDKVAKDDFDLTGNALGQQIFGGAGDNVLKGMGGADKLYGNGGNDSFNGGTGADIMFGGSGNDTYYVDNKGDGVRESAGGTDLVKSSISYTLGTSVERLELVGDSAVSGKGNSGNNWIYGNVAQNVLTGNGGKDYFIFTSALTTKNYDTITDFGHSTDAFYLNDSVFKDMDRGTLDKLSFTEISSSKDTRGVDSNDYILYDKQAGNLFFDRDGSGTEYSRVGFAHVDGGTTLDYSDFIFY